VARPVRLAIGSFLMSAADAPACHPSLRARTAGPGEGTVQRHAPYSNYRKYSITVTVTIQYVTVIKLIYSITSINHSSTVVVTWMPAVVQTSTAQQATRVPIVAKNDRRRRVARFASL